MRNPQGQLVFNDQTLAKVYLEQKKYQKAIQAYEILILKYPEKSSFFADRISDIQFYNKIIIKGFKKYINFFSVNHNRLFFTCRGR